MIQFIIENITSDHLTKTKFNSLGNACQDLDEKADARTECTYMLTPTHRQALQISQIRLHNPDYLVNETKGKLFETELQSLFGTHLTKTRKRQRMITTVDGGV